MFSSVHYRCNMLSQVLNLDLVTAVVKPSSGITRSDLPERLLHRLQQSFVGAPTNLSQNVLDLGERLLNGVQIWGVEDGTNTSSAPLASMSSLIPLGLCAPRLSITTTCPSESVGAKKCST